MLEQAIEQLTAEVLRLREAIGRQNELLMASPQPEPGRAPGREKSGEVYITDQAVADLAGLSVATLRRWRWLQKGPPFRRFGSAVRYSREEVLAWLDGREIARRG